MSKREENKIVGRADISDAIYSRLESSINKKDIRHAVNIICEEMSDTLTDNCTITVKNFGTFNPYLYHSHLAYNVQTKDMRMTKPSWTVRFHSHVSFEKLVKSKLKSFKKKKP